MAAAAGAPWRRHPVRVPIQHGSSDFRPGMLVAFPAPVPSAAHQGWSIEAARALDEIEAAHRAVGGSGQGRRYATLQLNHAYAMLLSSQFQRFCRNLHSEAVDFLVAHTQPADVAEMLGVALMRGRKLDHGNPNPGNLGADFSRFRMDFWALVGAHDARSAARQARLEEMNSWRNAIAHQDWDRTGGNAGLRVGLVRSWRSACNGLSRSFDAAVCERLLDVVGDAPW